MPDILIDTYNEKDKVILFFKKFNIKMRKIKKCIIPAAGMWTRFLPATKALPKEMFPIIDKPVMQILVEEAVSVGCEEIIIITWRNKRAIEDHFDANIELENKLILAWKEKLLKKTQDVTNMAKFVYVRQAYPKWDWDAILQAEWLIGNEPFLVLFWDDIVDHKQTAAQQLLKAYESTKSTVIASIQVSDAEVSSYGIIESSTKWDIFTVEKFFEKPKQEETNSRNWVIWKYILSPDIFEYLHKAISGNVDGELRLADALELMRQDKKIYWVDIKWERFDTWSKLGYLKAVISHGLQDEELAPALKEYLKNIKN